LHNFRNARRSRDRIEAYNLSEYLALLAGGDEARIAGEGFGNRVEPTAYTAGILGEDC